MTPEEEVQRNSDIAALDRGHRHVPRRLRRGEVDDVTEQAPSTERLTATEVANLRAAFEWEAAIARVDYPRDLLMAIFDRACVTAATRGGRQFGPLNQRPGPDPEPVS